MRLTPPLILLLVAVLLVIPGCPRPPKGTMEYTDSSGHTVLVADMDLDGVPDIGPDGNVLVVNNSNIYDIAQKLDSGAPGLLSVTAAVITPYVPWLAAVLAASGYLWKSSKFGRVFANTVTTIQAVRRQFADNDKILEAIDKTLSIEQLPETVAMVKDVKDKLQIASVTKT